MSLLQQFRRLAAPGPVRSVVTVVSIDATAGTSLVQTMGGSQFVALGTDVAAGSRAYIEGRRIVGTAANLPYSEMEV